jgi:hypothetical protein
VSVKKPAAKVKEKSTSTITAATKNSKASTEVSQTRAIDSRSTKDRRQGDRRQKEVPVPVELERRSTERRVKVSRRRQIDPTTCERDYSLEEVEFMSALDDYKRRSGRMFPTCSEVLEVLRGLGYEKRVDSPLAATPAESVSVVVTSEQSAV